MNSTSAILSDLERFEPFRAVLSGVERFSSGFERLLLEFLSSKGNNPRQLGKVEASTL